MAILPPPRSRTRQLEIVPQAIFGADDHASTWPTRDYADFERDAALTSTLDLAEPAARATLPPPPLMDFPQPLPPPPLSSLPRPFTFDDAELGAPHEHTASFAPISASPAVSASADATSLIDLREAPAASDDVVAGTLIAQNVSAWFGARKVLDRCSLNMPAGQVTAIIGPSGCGKSVFLRNLNRMHEVIPTAKMGGLVTLDGVDIHGGVLNSTEVRLRIGMVFQRPNPFPSMSIRENVLAGLKLSGVKTSNADELVEWSLRRGGLWNEVKDRLGQSGAALSGGQQQRLCIARSLAVRPRVLLMDEPCSALDPISTRVIEETILEIGREITVVIVTHNMQQAQRVADLCAFFMIDEQGSPGRVVESGPTHDIFNNPRDQRTSDYVSGRFG